MPTDLQAYHQRLLEQMKKNLVGNTQRLRIKKKTISNLFRYDQRVDKKQREVDLSMFNKPLALDKKNLTLDVQGLTTFEKIVDFTLPKGYLPLITPELKHITIGGAIVGIGIEANTYKFGFVHNSLLEADVLLPDGRIVTCSPTNRYADLFNGLANSYGTLGYILRAKIQLRRSKPYMKLHTERFFSPKKLLAAIRVAVDDPTYDAIESLIYSKTELYLTKAIQTQTVPQIKSIYGSTVFYKEISRPNTFVLPMKDYLFRYDPEWFWNLPETRLFRFFRMVAPVSLRNSGVYTQYANRNIHLPFVDNAAEDEKLEQLIQDWEVPWVHASDLLNFVLDTVDLNGKPLAIVPIKVPKNALCYSMKVNEYYLNIGSYSFVKRKPKQPLYSSTKIIDEFCFSHGGIKMLYSSTFINKTEFDRIYNGKAYMQLKKKYDSRALVPTLFEKAVLGQ